MKRRIFKSTLLTLLFSLLFSLNVFAAGFTQDAAGIHYQNDDGTFVTSSWVEVSNLWFLFDANGICVNPTGALAPDDTDGNSQKKRGCLELSVFRHPFLSNSLITLQYAHCNFTDYFQF